MIFDRLEQSSRYAMLHPLFAEAFDVLRSTNWLKEPPAARVIIPDRLTANAADVEGRGYRLARLEAHRRFLDIQYVVQGEDRIGWSHVADAGAIAEPYSAEKDITFYAGIPKAWVSVPTGHFVIFFTDDAHAPLAGDGPLRKVVVKVAIAG